MAALKTLFFNVTTTGTGIPPVPPVTRCYLKVTDRDHPKRAYIHNVSRGDFLKFSLRSVFEPVDEAVELGIGKTQVCWAWEFRGIKRGDQSSNHCFYVDKYFSFIKYIDGSNVFFGKLNEWASR